MNAKLVGPKTLLSMPEDVRRSAWGATENQQPAARVLRHLEDGLYWMAYLVSAALWAGVAALGAFCVASFLGFSAPPFWYWLPALHVVVAAALAVAHQRLEAFMCMPRKDPAFPLIYSLDLDRELIGRVCKFAAAEAILYGSLAFSLGSEAPTSRLWGLAVLCGVVGCGLWRFGHVFPGWGQSRVPTREEDAEKTRQAQAKTQGNSASVQRDSDYIVPVIVRQPERKFDDIAGMADVKKSLLEPARAILQDAQTDAQRPRNGMLLHGEPGNGKTVLAEALAGELEVPIIVVTQADVSSKWLGEAPRLIKRTFEYAKANSPCVLFIDEIDGLIRKRGSASAHAEDDKVVNALLTELVDVRRHAVVVVAATNFLEHLDVAAIREGRFDFKVEITPPDAPARLGILRAGIRKHADAVFIDDAALQSIATRWSGFSAARLEAITMALPKYAHEAQKRTIGFDDWISVLRVVQGRKSRIGNDTKGLAELLLDADTREGLELVAARLRDVHRIEQFGGTLPSGLLFHGPSGTGKTAAARALAKECGWAFIATSGPDLIADRQALPRLFVEAAELRPALVFIDEADDALRDRKFSATPEVVNKFLSLMDGAGERTRDVVVVAATNHPEEIDSALLRSGRFTEKIEFRAPPASHVAQAIDAWLCAKKVCLESGLEVPQIAGKLGGHTIANVEGVLQYALNRAIAGSPAGQKPAIRVQDVDAAIRVVLAE
ncbi:MAG: AAA family ATPase [Vicinamibacterales bacterium]